MALRTNYKNSHVLHRPKLSLGAGKGITSYDESGQVFTETRCYGGPMTTDWFRKTKRNPREAENFRSRGAGCWSLVNMAIRSVLHNSYSITPESLEGVPWELASVLWQRIVASQLDSVKVWKAFACAFPHEVDETLKRKHHIIHKPNMKLIDYMKPVISPSLNWITSLTLSNITCSRTDLIQISRIINIGTLSIGPNVQAPDIGIDDSIIRSWGRLAADSDAFSVLRVLSCRSQKEMTHRIFTYLNQFPSLDLFNVEDSNLGPQGQRSALQHGWKSKTGVDLSNLFVKGGTEGVGWDSVVDACFRLGGQFCTEALTEVGVTEINDLPLLHLTLAPGPAAPTVNKAGSRSLQCFYRTKREGFQRDDPLQNSNKRNSEEVQPKLPRKKPTMRASKQQNLEDVLVDFSG